MGNCLGPGNRKEYQGQTDLVSMRMRTLVSLLLRIPLQYQCYSSTPVQQVPLSWPCQAGPSESPGTSISLHSEARGLILRAGLAGAACSMF